MKWNERSTKIGKFVGDGARDVPYKNPRECKTAVRPGAAPYADSAKIKVTAEAMDMKWNERSTKTGKFVGDGAHDVPYKNPRRSLKKKVFKKPHLWKE